MILVGYYVGTDDRKLTLSFLKEFLDKSRGTSSGSVELIDAFHIPLVQYDPIRHMFHLNTKGRRIVGDIKVCMWELLVQEISISWIIARL